MADWGGGIYLLVSVGQWMVAQCAAVSLAHANQLPLQILESAALLDSDSCKEDYSKCKFQSFNL